MFSLTARRVAPVAQRAGFATSARMNKSVVDSAKDALKKVDQTVSGAAVKGIEKGEEAAQAVKNTTSGDVKGKANELSGEAKGKAQELKGEAKGKAAEVKGKI